MEKINLIEIGFGPHARRIYYPISIIDGKKYNFEIVQGVDLLSQKPIIDKYFVEKKYSPIDFYYIKDNLAFTDKLDPIVEADLNNFVKNKNIKGVIISTEPLAHIVYAKWALKKGLSILMDKPISTEENVSTDLKAVNKLISDFNKLEKLYISEKTKNKKILFSLMSQRRYHPAFNKIKDLIVEVWQKTNCPITSIQTFHSDGQWRMPTEIVEQHYHPYNQGYGKCSHSGYHSIDMIPWFLSLTENDDKKIDNVDVFTNVVRPNDFYTQLNTKDYTNLFPDYEKHNKYSSDKLKLICKNFGEIDAFSSFAFKSGNNTLSLASNNLVHNGFAQRNWVTAVGHDLYKGNGRVRHENFYIEQGPFQSISYTSYQGKEVDPNNMEGIYDIGGEYHLDIHVFRNDKMFSDWKNYEKFSIKDLNINVIEGESRGHQEDARRQAILEFVFFLQGKPIEPKSDYLDHWRSTMLLHGVYKSMAARFNNKNPLINIPFIH